MQYINTTAEKFRVSKLFFFKEITTFIQQGIIQLIESDSNDIYVHDVKNTPPYRHENALSKLVLIHDQIHFVI